MEDILDFAPKKLNFSLNESSQTISIQNLTLHFINISINQPQNKLVTLEPCTSVEVKVHLILDVNLNLKALDSNRHLVMYFYDVDDTEEYMLNGKDWAKLPLESLGRYEIPIQLEKPSLSYKIHFDQGGKVPIENILVYRLLNLSGTHLKLDDELKKGIMASFQEKFSKYDTYLMLDDQIIFVGEQLEVKNDVLALHSGKRLSFIAIYKPSWWLKAAQMRPVEPMSPAKQLPQKKAALTQSQNQKLDQAEGKQEEHNSEVQPMSSPNQTFQQGLQTSQAPPSLQQMQHNADQQTQRQEITSFTPLTDVAGKIEDSIENQKSITSDGQSRSLGNQIKSIPSVQIAKQHSEQKQSDISRASMMTYSSDKGEQRRRQNSVSVDRVKRGQGQGQGQAPIKTQNWDQKAKLEQKAFVAPPVVFKHEQKYQFDYIQRQTQSQSLNLIDVAHFKTFQSVQHILLFRDGKYLITVGDKQEIKVWNLSTKGLDGQLKELEGKKERKILIIQEFRYVDPTADENYTFQLKDPSAKSKHEQLYTSYETAYRFITGSEDQKFRIFNLTSMTLEQEFDCRLQIPTTLAFMPDKGLFCIGGQPKKTIFGQTRKYRSLRFFCMKNLQEKPKYKIFCKHDDEFLNSVIYSDNSMKNEVHHTRLNNTLAIQVHRRTSQGKQLASSARIIFVFIDRQNQFTVLMTLECEQLSIRGVNHMKYIRAQGQFAVIEANDVVNDKNQLVSQDTQKLVMVNIKQLKTEKGMQNGLECNLIQEQKSKVSIQMLSNPPLIVIPQKLTSQRDSQSPLKEELAKIAIQNLQGEEIFQQAIDIGEKNNQELRQLSVTNNFIVSVINDTVSVISLQ